MGDLSLTKLIGSILPSQNIVVGGKTTTTKSSGIPVDVRVSIDPEFSKTILKTTSIISISIVAGVAISKLK